MHSLQGTCPPLHRTVAHPSKPKLSQGHGLVLLAGTTRCQGAPREYARPLGNNVENWVEWSVTCRCGGGGGNEILERIASLNELQAFSTCTWW